MLTTRQAAAMIGKSTRWVSRLVKAGRLTPAYKLPGGTGAYLFNESAVMAYKERAHTK